MDRYNKYQTKQLHAHAYICTHNSWWLVLGWVTTKEYHPLPRLDRPTSTYVAFTKTLNNNNSSLVVIKRCSNILQSLQRLAEVTVDSELTAVTCQLFTVIQRYSDATECAEEQLCLNSPVI